VFLTSSKLEPELKLNAACGGNEYAFYDLQCQVNCDIQKPKTKIPNFVLCDVQHLPFRDRVFRIVFAFNVLEHVDKQVEAESELKRVSDDEVWIRLDKFCNLANWFTYRHKGVAFKNSLIPFPNPIRAPFGIVQFLTGHSKVFRKVVYGSFPFLRKMGVLDAWNYYRIK